MLASVQIRMSYKIGQMDREQRIDAIKKIIRTVLKDQEIKQVTYSRFAAMLQEHSGKFTCKQHVNYWVKNGIPVNNGRLESAISLAKIHNPEFEL